MSGLNYKLLGEDSDEENGDESILDLRRQLAQACIDTLKSQGIDDMQSAMARDAKESLSNKLEHISDDIDIEETLRSIKEAFTINRGGKCRGHKLSVTSVCQSGDFCFAGSRDGTLTAWEVTHDTETGKYGLEIKWSIPGQPSLRAHSDYVASVIREGLKTNQVLAAEEGVTCTRKRNVHFTKPLHPYCYERNGVSSLPPYEFGHFGAINCICASECGKYIISGGVDGLINIRSIENGKSLFTFACAPPSSNLAANRRLVENNEDDDYDENEEKKARKIIRDFSDNDPYAVPCYPTALSACSNNRFVAGLGKMLVIYSITDRCELFRLMGHTDSIKSIKWINYLVRKGGNNYTDDETFVVTCSLDGTVRYFDLLNQSHLIYDCPTPVYSVTTLKSNKFLGTGPEGLYCISKEKAKPTEIALPQTVKNKMCLADSEKNINISPIDSVGVSSGAFSMMQTAVLSSSVLDGADLLLTGCYRGLQLWKIGNTTGAIKEIGSIDCLPGYVNDLAAFKAYDEKSQTYHILVFVGLGQEPKISRMSKDIAGKNGVGIFEVKTKTMDAEGNLKIKPKISAVKKQFKSRFK